MREKLFKNQYFRIGLIAIGVFLIFLLGILVGDGHISFDTNNETGNLPNTLNYKLIQQEYSIIKNNYDGNLNLNTIEDGVLNGLANSTGDPHTNYFNALEAKQFIQELNNTFSGIGAELDNNSKGQIEVVSTLQGTPAYKAGLQTGDIILTINGKSTQGESINDAVDSIHGQSGTIVTLGVQRGSNNLTFKITREQIVVPSVNYKILSGNIGYMDIISFADDTPSLAQKAANYFAQNKVKGIILDLRDNPGGLVNSAVSVCSLWLPEGQVVMTEKHDGKPIQTYKTFGGDVLDGMPTVVLINSGSASASEITAGALKDHKVATLIGEKSYGKGSVQQIFNLSGGRQIKVTIAHWYTPNNVNIDKVGIEPDIVVPLSQTDQQSGNDAQLSAAINYLNTH
jgi:carboxyl-terminal processing protease